MSEQVGTVCPKCSGVVIFDEDMGEHVCTKCGLVVHEKVEAIGYESVSRTFIGTDKDVDNTHHGPANARDKGSMIPNVNMDSSYQYIGEKNFHMFDRLRRMSRLTDTSEQRFLRQYMSKVDVVADSLALSSPIRERTRQLFAQSRKHHLLKGRSTMDFLWASAYLACREAGTFRSLHDVEKLAKSMGCRSSGIGVAIRMMQDKFELNARPLGLSGVLHTHIAKMNLHPKIGLRAKEYYERIKDSHELQGKNPHIVAAALIYLASVSVGDPMTQKAVADATGSTEVSLRGKTKLLVKLLRLESREPRMFSN